MSFKLIAIRPLEGCNPKVLKNLKENLTYKFYNDYQFYIGDELITDSFCKETFDKILFKSTVPENFFNQGDDEENIKINISAIVGQNGSGKSAIVELLVASIVKISLEIDSTFIDPENLYYTEDTEKKNHLIEEFKKSVRLDLSSIHAEIFFIHKAPSIYRTSSGIEKIRCIRIKDDTIRFLDYEQSGSHGIYIKGVEYDIHDYFNESPLNGEGEVKINFFKDFFYTMIINYSHYGYNTKESGEWLKGVFHKNDGYQLPVVINPYREEGNIDINSEKYLASSRFLVNILQKKALRAISEGKVVSHISIEVDKSKFSEWDEKELRDLRIVNTEEDKIDILEDLMGVFFNDGKKKSFKKTSGYYPFLRDYILLKLYKITNYKRYEKYKCGKDSIFIWNENPKHFTLTGINNLTKYFYELDGDTSHVTEKLRQALFLLKDSYLDDEEIFESKSNESLISIDNLFDKLNTSYASFLKDKLISEQFLNPQFTTRHSLPSLFKINYFFTEKYSATNNFNHFSSGEKQKLFSIHSVIYHLRNLKSVQEHHEGGTAIYYKNVNIIFDEIELYAHPDFQRKFIYDFLAALKVINHRYDDLNIIFITHSPFILSDIPKQNVLFLNDGLPQLFERKNTFGANITDLFVDSFFYAEALPNKLLMGEFAKHKINEIIALIRTKNIKKKYDVRKIIDLIDEPLIKTKLLEMYYDVFDKDMIEDLELKELERLAEKYNKRIGDV